MGRGMQFRRVGTPLDEHELDRARRAARIRQMPVSEFLRQAIILVSDQTLASRRFRVEAWERRDVNSFPIREG